MTYLIELPSVIQPNASAYSSAIVSFYLISMAYHQSLPVLLYLLYGTNHDPNNTLTPYQDYFLLQFNISSNSVVHNYTGLPLNCTGECRVKATSSMLLIESRNHIRLYSMFPDKTTVNIGSPFLIKAKTWVSPSSLIQYQCADIFGSTFAYSDGQHVYFISYSSTTAATASFFFTFPAVHSQVYSISITAGATLIAVRGNPGKPLLYSIECTACIFSYSYTSGTVMPSSMYKTFQTAVTLTYRFRMTRADVSYQSNGITAMWTLVDSIFIKTSTTVSTFTFTMLATIPYTIDVPGFSTNYKQFISWGSSSTIRMESYSLQDISQNLYIPGGYSVSKAIISNNTDKLAVMDSSTTSRVRLFMLVNDCSSYYSTQSGQMCICSQYINNECKDALKSTGQEEQNSEGPSLMIVVIASVVGASVLVFGFIVIYKLCKYHQKISRRTPWKYNAREFIEISS